MYFGSKNIKLVLMMISLMVVLSGCVIKNYKSINSQENDFVLDLEMTKGETSKDEHGFINKLKIHNKQAEHEIDFWGRAGTNYEKNNYELTEKGLENLIKFIKDNGLDKNLVEEKPDKDTGVFVSLKLRIKIDGLETTSHISGMINDWEVESEGSKTNIDNLDYYKNVEKILDFVANKSEKI